MSGGTVLLVDLEKKVQCPYNAAHYILPERLSSHLIKCKKQHTDVKISICPFNSVHHVREEHLHSHIKECRDKDIVERELFIRNNPDVTPKPNSSEEKVLNIRNNNEENWDVGNNASSYDPMKNVLHMEIARNPPPGFGKSGKKRWRAVDYERIKLLKEGKSILDLVYPTPTGGFISIRKMLNELEKPEGSSPDTDRQNQRPPSPSKPPITDLPKLRVPNIFNNKKIAANIFGKIPECDMNSTVETEVSDMDQMSDISSVGSKSYNGVKKMDRQHYLDLWKTHKKFNN